MRPSLDDLRYLEALDRLRTATAAGRDLGVAPSTVYRRIAALEREVGFPCLARTRGITPAGRELAQLARTTIVTLAEIGRRARLQRESLTGTITLTTIDGFVPLLVKPLAALAARYPLLRVDVHVSEAGLSLRRQEADLGLALLDRPPPVLVGRKLFPVPFGVFGTHELAADPDRARWVVLGPPSHTSWLGRWERAHVPRDRIALATPSRRLLVDLISQGVGIGLMASRLAVDRPELVELRTYRAATAPLAVSAWLLAHPDRRRDPRIALVMKELARMLAGA